MNISGLLFPFVRNFSPTVPSGMNCGLSTERPRVMAPGTAGLVGLDGLEPSTSRLSGARSNHLSYKPLLCVSDSSHLSARVRSLFGTFVSLPSGMNFKVSFERPRVVKAGLPAGGDDGIRTHDPLLAGQVLSQLSYTPIPRALFFSRIISGP